MMATSYETNWEMVKQELTCSICQDLLNNPKILPCLHSFCTGCLKEWLGRVPSYLEASKQELECPLQCCGGKITLSSPRAIEELPSHFSAIRMLEIIRLQERARSDTPNCQSCEEDSAASSCSECAIFLCKFCEKAHRKVKATKNHSISSLEDMRKNGNQIPPVLTEKDEMCPTHPTEPLELYCRCKNVLICGSCIKKHKDHDYDVISDVVDSEKEILKETLPDIQQLIDEVEGAVNGVKSKRQVVENRKKDNLHKLDGTFEALHAALDERKRQLQQHIAQDADGKDKGLALQEVELCSLLSQLKSCWSFIGDKLQRGVSKDVLSMKKSMLQRRDTLKEVKCKAELNPINQEQFPITLRINNLISRFSSLGLFCDPGKCVINHIKNIVPINKKTSVRVLLKDTSGKDINNAEEIDVQIIVQYADASTDVASVRAVNASACEGSYVCKGGESHAVFVFVGGYQIPGSPLNVETRLRDYTKLESSNCQLITQYGGKQFQHPRDVAITNNDEFVIVDSDNRDIIVLDKDLNLIKIFGQDRLNNPESVAVGKDVIAVSEYSDMVVKKFSLIGEYLSEFGSCGSEDGKFYNPQGLAFNSNYLLYVVDHGNCRVQVFDVNDDFLFKFGSKGSSPGQLQYPRCIALDTSDQVYVTDQSGSGGIVMFSEAGKFITKIDRHKPYAICLTPGEYILTNDHSDNCFIVFDPAQKEITTFGMQGNEKGQFNHIHGIAINSVGTILISEGSNRRLQVIHV